MRYLRLFCVSFLSALVITGCHHRRERATPPPQAQAPIVATLPPIPPLSFPNVQIAKPKPPAPVVEAPAPPPPKKKKRRERVRRRVHKPETETAANVPTEPAAVNGTAVLGQLSADDTTNPNQNTETERLIRHTENRLKKMSRSQRARHKDAIVQVNAFLAQAKQAWAMNDMVGASTLANKAKILLDEILK